MKILVTVAEEAAVDDGFEFDGTRIDDRYLTYDLNEWDGYALEEAVQLGETHDDAEVVTATVGPERTEETIRQALAKGADRAVRVWGDALDGTEILDPGTKARLLGAVAREEEPDLVLSGVQTGDNAFGATGVALASLLGYEWAAVVNSLDVDREAGVARVHRELEGGVEELTDVELPAVFTVQTGLNEPRYASLRGIRQAQNRPLVVRSPADLGLAATDIGSALSVDSLYEPETESDVTLFEGEAEESAGALAALLEKKEVGA
jgi:Electron transfer flavoprotein, beta subunit